MKKERIIKFDKITNFRDMDGYVTKDMTMGEMGSTLSFGEIFEDYKKGYG